MEIPRTQTEESSSQYLVVIHEEADETQLNISLHRLETFLSFFGFCKYSFWRLILSWTLFLFVGVAVPVLIIELSRCSGGEKCRIKSFELEILVSQSLIAAISLLCISHNISKYGLRNFLFVDRYHGHRAQFLQDYRRKIDDFFRLLTKWIVPCFCLKAAREIMQIIYVHPDSWFQSAAILFSALVSWTYSTIIFLSGGALFNLVCNLQVIHLEGFGRLLERDLDVSLYLEEHMLLTHHISKISHRFRIFLLLEFLFVTVSQVIALLETTGNRGIINFINGGDFAVSSIYELAGIVICLLGAAKISHRGHGLASITSKWHALVTCNVNDGSQSGITSKDRNSDVANTADLLPISYSESDLELDDYVPVPTNSQLSSNMSLYHKRQAFVLYLQTNPRGVTVFGWTIDRTLLNTIFFVELSLVLFVLGKTITFTTS